jgi:hypothetical protein
MLCLFPAGDVSQPDMTADSAMDGAVGNTGLESPVNRQAEKPALRPMWPGDRWFNAGGQDESSQIKVKNYGEAEDDDENEDDFYGQREL